MAKTVVLDELHLTIRVRADLPEDDVAGIRKILFDEDFRVSLLQTICGVVQSIPRLADVSLTLSR